MLILSEFLIFLGIKGEVAMISLLQQGETGSTGVPDFVEKKKRKETNGQLRIGGGERRARSDPEFGA